VNALFELQYWPLWAGAACLVAAAVLHAVLDVVPNALTALSFITGLIVAALATAGQASGAGGGMQSALMCAAVGGGVVIAFWLRKLAPGGTVKMHLAFCTWIGAAVPLWKSLSVTLLATAFPVIAVGLALLAARRSYRAAQREAGPESEVGVQDVPVQLLASACTIVGVVCAALLGWLD
jgi:hypothetical protein